MFKAFKMSGHQGVFN